jgi:hypothetical protein
LHDGEFLVYFSAMGRAEVRVRLTVWVEGDLNLEEQEKEQIVCVEYVNRGLLLRAAMTEELGYPCTVGGCQTLIEPKGALMMVQEDVDAGSDRYALTVSALSPEESCKGAR